MNCYPFGMVMPGRKYQTGAGLYRYGFNGQEKSDEIKGEGNSYTAEFWEYDPRIGRRWNVDPVYKSSPYECFLSNPIMLNDPYGLDPDKPGKKVGERITGTTGKDKTAETYEWNGSKWNIAKFAPVVIIGKRGKTAQKYANEKALDQTHLIWKEAKRERMRQFTVDYNISPELAAQIDVTITEQKNSINIRNFNLSGNSMEKDIRSISIDMTYKILFGASLIEGSIPALMGGEEIIGLYRPAITFATNPTIELDYLLNRTLNNLTEDLFYALRYHLRNVLSLPNLIRLEKLAEKYRDYQKLYKQISN